MAEKAAPGAGKILLVWEEILKWSAFTIMCLHLGRSILMYFIPERITNLFFKAEKWILIALIAAVLMYVLYTIVKTPGLTFRIKNFTKGLFRPEFILLVLFFVWSFICTIVSESGQTSGFFQSLFSALKNSFMVLIDDSTLFDTFVSVFICISW